MQGKIVLAKLATDTEGFSLSMMTEESSETLLIINGNKPNYSGVVALLNIDPEVVYGMSRSEVGRRILSTQPQRMLATKEMAHKLYEHGMKASWWKINIQKTPVLTTMDSFYEITQEYKHQSIKIDLVQGKGKKSGLLVTVQEKKDDTGKSKVYLVTNRWFEFDSHTLPSISKHIVLEDIDPYTYLE